MCGIAGYAGLDDQALLREMCASIAHRGPDDEGFYTAPGVGLAMRRLAVIDLDTGRQPIPNETRTVWVVFNGEIYNYQDLRGDLAAKGHRLATTSDTETIVHLYEEHDVEFVQHLRGMFAIALWDAPRQRLVLARDRIGEKPLYYRVSGTRLVFGSEIKAVLREGGSRAPDRQSIVDFLALGYMQGGRTAFEGVQKLMPGHRLVFEGGQARVERYWRRGSARSSLSFPEATEQLADTLDDSVRLALKSDVEVGAFLSGGLDSSLLAALMQRRAARVQTFTVGYAGHATGFNELAHARRAARHIGTAHHELILGAHSSLELLPRILSHYDEPHGEPTSVLVYQLSEFTRRHVKVAVAGTGADEIFFGYPRHRGVRILDYYRRCPRVVRTHLVERVVARWPESTSGSRFAKRARRFIRGANESAADAYVTWVRLLARDIHHDLLAEQTRAVPDPAGDRFLRDHLAGATDSEVLDRAAAVDVDGYLPEYQLAYIDSMSMAHGLEVRSPLCDYRLVDFVMGLPAAYRLNGLRSKHILKTVAGRWLPASTIDRPKVGFDSPIGHWFKNELRTFLRTFLAPEHVQRTGLLNPEGVQRLIGDHLAGRYDHSLQLWSVLMVEAWYRMYIDDGVRDGRGYRVTDLRGAGDIADGEGRDRPSAPR